MIGFDGDPERAAELRHALDALLEVFPEHLAKAQPPTWFDADELVRNDQFDAILRAHKKDRLAIPIQALRSTGAPYHNFDLMNWRRLAWFVPSLLASWLDHAPGPADRPFGASDLEAIVAAGVEWTEEEATALETFFEAALDAALATPLPPPRAPDEARPREDGIRVWSLHYPSIPLEVLRVARTLHVDLDLLVARWALTPSELALEHLLEAVYDPTVASKHYLAHEAVADRLGEAFFEATGEHQARLSKAEATVRRNIARREDV
ncbi:MAG: hypothetical protein U0270_15025 [Labilithrix sp.]